jgi:hypothetical protein
VPLHADILRHAAQLIGPCATSALAAGSPLGGRARSAQTCGAPGRGALTVIDGLLDAVERRRMLDQLSSPELLWTVQESASGAASGATYQLASSAEHERRPMRALARELGARCLAENHLVLDFLGITTIDAQVFPVLMTGDLERPPLQRPHRDGRSAGATTAHPVITMVYYLVVSDALGGTLVGLDVAGDEVSERFRHRPRSNQLVVMRGSQVHMVEPLWQGTRISVVVNFFEAGE